MKTNITLLLLLLSECLMAQSNISDSIVTQKNVKFRYEASIIPTVLVGYGTIGLESHTLKKSEFGNSK